ncbi:hypothetical protein IAR55_005733 [Kwoniella newhampshirensis]|uniref:CRIB domain-containing protein n=1 Tax=Kwoniella newhampshirensis TaxID=1651941 RepID=A0AAW0YST6_9TREE
MARPSPSRNDGATDKLLPPLPPGGLGLDFSGRTSIDNGDEEDHGGWKDNNPGSNQPSPFQLTSLCDKSPTSPLVASIQPSTPTTATSSSFSSRHTSSVPSTATLTKPTQSTVTAIMSESPSVAGVGPKASSSLKVEESRSTPRAGKRILFVSSSVSRKSKSNGTVQPISLAPPQARAPSTPTGSIDRLGRKRSSGQLLSGIGKGLDRVGSVLRRNTPDGRTPDSAKSISVRSGGGGNWSRGKKRNEAAVIEEADESSSTRAEKILEIKSGEDGDAGIGRPFKTEHDLHVSPDLSDLPPAWLESLKAQGLSESDLKLISAAHGRRHQSRDQPFEVGFKPPRTPLSAPAASTTLLDTGSQGHDASLSHFLSKHLPRKFSLELQSPKESTTTGARFRLDHLRAKVRDVFDAGYVSSPPSTAKEHDWPRGDLELYPVSAAESSDIDAETEGDESFSAEPGNFMQSKKERDNYTPRLSKRFSDQLRGFKESRFGLEEEGAGEWGRSILGAAWKDGITTTKEGQRPSLPEGESVDVSPAGTRTTSVDSDDSQAIPILPLEPEEPKTPLPISLGGSTQELYSPLRLPTNAVQSSSLHSGPQSVSSISSASRYNSPSFQFQLQQEPKDSSSLPRSRHSTDSFGVRYTSMSKSSPDLNPITPSTSTEDATPRMPNEEWTAIESRGDYKHDTRKIDTGSDQAGDGAEVAGDPPSPACSDLLTARRPDAHQQNASPATMQDDTHRLTQRSPSFPESMRPTTLFCQGSLDPFPTPGSESVPTSIAGSYEHLPLVEDITSGPYPYTGDGNDPQISFPTSATELSSLPSRCVTPIPVPTISERIQNQDTNHLSPERIRISPRRHSRSRSVREQTSYSTFDSTPYRLSPSRDPLEGLDGASPNERASIALSILSSEASTSIHSLHELREATVNVAYKGMIFPAGSGHEASSEKVSIKDVGRRSKVDEEGRGELGLDLIDKRESDENISTSDGVCPSDEAEGHTKDALDALGAAAMRIVDAQV